MIPGLIFADDFVGILGTPQGLQEQIRDRKWRMTANRNKCAVLGCNQDIKYSGEFQMEAGKKETANRRPVYKHWRRDVELFLGCTHN